MAEHEMPGPDGYLFDTHTETARHWERDRVSGRGARQAAQNYRNERWKLWDQTGGGRTPRYERQR